MKSTIENEFTEHLKVAQKISTLTNQAEIDVKLCIKNLQSNGKILIFGDDGNDNVIVGLQIAKELGCKLISLSV